MALTLPWRRPPVDTKAIEDKAIAKAIDAVKGAVLMNDAHRKSFLDGSAAQLTARGQGGFGGSPGYGSWGQGSGGALNAALIQRVTQNLSQNFNRTPEDIEVELARQGMTWGPPFPPGRPLDPFFGYRTPPRTRDYSVGENTQITPRWDRISFVTLKALWEAYDVAQICTKHLINDVRSLDYHFEAQLGVRDDVSEDIRKAREFFDSPDKRQPFRSWLAEYLMDAIRYDAGTLYIRRNRGGDAIALEVVSGATIIPQIDYYGRISTDEDDQDPNLTAAGTFHGEKVPGYVQIIQGMPATWLAADDVIYQPINPMPDSQYGLAPLEAVMLTANTDLRFQWHFLNFFTQGNIGAGFMEAPEDMSDPAQVAEFQQLWDAFMLGDQQRIRQIRWVPHGANFKAVGSSTYEFDENFPLYLMRRTCAAHGVTPADLGFTDTVNKATSETQVDVQFRVGTLPIVKHVEDVINLFLAEHLSLKVRLRFDTGREIEDRLATAQAMAIYIDHGVVSPEEERMRLGYPPDHAWPAPRYINNTRNGPVPMAALLALAGKLDPETYMPAKGTHLPDHPFVPVPGVMPPLGSQDAKNADNSTAAMQANMVALNAGKPAPFPDDASSQPPSPTRGAAQRPASKGYDDNDTLQAALDLISSLIADKEATAGITAATGMTGVDLAAGDDEEDEDEQAEKVAVQLRQWRENSRNRLRKGLPPRRFVSTDLPADISDAIWAGLSKAATRTDIDRVFRDADPKASPRSEPGALKSNSDHTGSGMVSLDIAPGVLPTVPGGIDDHHITVVFFGKDVDDDTLDAVCVLAERVAAATPGPVRGTVSGRGTFPASESSDWKVPVYANPTVSGIDQLRSAFEPFNASEHKDYHPHVTLAYVDDGADLPDAIQPTPLTFTHLSVHRGDEVRRFPFGTASKGKTVDAAGIAVVAEDTGRVLMIQRDIEDPSKQSSGKFEWPGGRLDDGEDPWEAAQREWEEETGNKLPKGEKGPTWTHDGYVCFVYRIAHEEDIHLNPAKDEMEVTDPDHPAAKQPEVAVWWDPKDAKHSEDALREEFEDFDWDLVKGSRDPHDFAEYRNRNYSVQTDALRAQGVTKVAWKGGTCKRCQLNKAVSPIDINTFWPDGPPPIHKDCGCSVVPAE